MLALELLWINLLLASLPLDLEWATNGDGAFVYITMDQTLRPHKVLLLLLNFFYYKIIEWHMFSQ